MTPRQLLNNAYAQGMAAERTRWRPLFQMLHSLEPELRIGRVETAAKSLRIRDANQHDLVLKLLEMAPTWPTEEALCAEEYSDGRMSAGPAPVLGSAPPSAEPAD